MKNSNIIANRKPRSDRGGKSPSVDEASQVIRKLNPRDRELKNPLKLNLNLMFKACISLRKHTILFKK